MLGRLHARSLVYGGNFLPPVEGVVRQVQRFGRTGTDAQSAGEAAGSQADAVAGLHVGAFAGCAFSRISFLAST